MLTWSLVSVTYSLLVQANGEGIPRVENNRKEIALGHLRARKQLEDTPVKRSKALETWSLRFEPLSTLQETLRYFHLIRTLVIPRFETFTHRT